MITPQRIKQVILYSGVTTRERKALAHIMRCMQGSAYAVNCGDSLANQDGDREAFERCVLALDTLGFVKTGKTSRGTAIHLEGILEEFVEKAGEESGERPEAVIHEFVEWLCPEPQSLGPAIYTNAPAPPPTVSTSAGVYEILATTFAEQFPYGIEAVSTAEGTKLVCKKTETELFHGLHIAEALALVSLVDERV